MIAILRFGLLIVVAGFLMLLRNLIDPLGLCIGVFLSHASPFFELLGGIESIAVDSAILFVCGGVLLPKTYSCWMVLAVGGALYCLWNLLHYDTFAFMPFGYDPDAEGGINWRYNIIYMGVYALCAWILKFREPVEEVENIVTP